MPLAAVWELSRDLRIETLYIIGTAEHGTLYVCRWFGTNAEGGDFDAVYVCIGLLRGGEPAGLEIFELDDLDTARARFEELREACHLQSIAQEIVGEHNGRAEPAGDALLATFDSVVAAVQAAVALHPLRSDPRFTTLLKKVGLGAQGKT